MNIKNITLTSIAMLAFAANSIFCRLALLDNSIDATSFTVIRIISGALILTGLVAFKAHSYKHIFTKPPLRFALALTAYAVCFSYAYIQLSAATGALILFTSVQLTMVIYSLYQGHRYSKIKWFAYSLCLIGFFVLVLPTAEQPQTLPLILMVISGIAWGAYSLFAKATQEPLQTVQQAFLWSVPIVILLLVLVWLVSSSSIHATGHGIVLAVLSGAIASGLGYFLWYIVLQKITSFNAAVAQLTVPIITAAIAIVLLGENINLQFIFASVLIITGLLINVYKED